MTKEEQQQADDEELAYRRGCHQMADFVQKQVAEMSDIKDVHMLLDDLVFVVKRMFNLSEYRSQFLGHVAEKLQQRKELREK